MTTQQSHLKRRGRNPARALKLVGGALASVIGIGWLGFQVEPAPFPPFPEAQGPVEVVPLPEGLPAPVERFYRELYGEQIPVIESAVITGRAELRMGGLTMPARFRFTHAAGEGYRHYIEVTWFGQPIMRVNERYLDGEGVGELPFGIVERGPKQNQGANLGMWSEALWFPSIFLTDPRVRWEPVDESSARLIVPFEDSEETYVVQFDPETALPTRMEAMRYKGSEAPHKTMWTNDVLGWTTLDGVPTMKRGAATWADEGEPWAIFTAEEIHLNVDVDAYLRQEGL